MWRSTTWVMALLAMCVCITQGQDLQELIVSKRSGVRMCGEKLIQSLMVVCDNKYNKRNYYRYDRKKDEEMWQPRYKAVSLLTMTRTRRGVVDECCNKSCSIRELSSYCLEAY